MGNPLKKEKTDRYSWDDYLAWPANERWEIIDGAAYNMTPAPSFRHQKVAGRIYSKLEVLLAGKTCTPAIAPTDVVLSRHDIVQPDVFVVCDPKKITDANIQGTPDLVFEVLSPATALKDLREKKDLYERFGVKEYVIVDPIERYAQRFLLGDDGVYDKGAILGPEETLLLDSLGGLEIGLREVFGEEAQAETLGR